MILIRWRSSVGLVAAAVAVLVHARSASAQAPAPAPRAAAQPGAADQAPPAGQPSPAGAAPTGAPTPGTQPGAQPTEPGSQAEQDKLLEQLLTEGMKSDEDLKWLYSDQEEYAPSGLVGKPIPAPGLPQRGEGSARTWDPSWRRFSLGDYILTGGALVVAGGSALIPANTASWRGTNSFDESVRNAIGITSYDRGLWARDLSDVGLSVAVSYPVLVDSLIVTYWYRRSSDVAGQMALITAESVAVAAALQGLSAGLTKRERPYGRNCGGSIDPELDACKQSTRNRSFFSGHTTVSFAAAAVSCSHHAHHDVFGDPLADALSCASGFTVAGVVGTMRIVGDQHYATDVLMGAGIGTLSGLGVPWLLHYGPLARVSPKRNEASQLTLTLVPVGNGLGVAGAF